ncbi:MAG: helix-turn-helix domain-containing protein [Phycisphaera sp.]|nr:helix-turn-helix domain-containing protein [Phycisphaera sp.]
MNRTRIKNVLYASHWWLEEMMSLVAQWMALQGWHLDFQMCLTGELPSGWEGDGILTTFSGDPNQLKHFFAARRCPAVSLNLNYPEIDVPRVDVDATASGRLAADHLIGRGYRSLAFYTAARWHTTDLAVEAFERTAEGYGFKAHRLYWERDPQQRRNDWPQRSRWLIGRLNELPKPLGVFAPAIEGASEVVEACVGASLAVPEQVGVLGMMDSPIFRQCMGIELSRVTVDLKKQTHAACELLRRMIEGEPPPSEPILIPPTGIVSRQSTDTIAARNPDVARAIRFIFTHYHQTIGVPDVVEASGLSRTVAYQAFEADLGQTPNAVLMRVRLEKAAQRLRESDDKIEAIALACGFGNRIHFHRHFSRRFGITPATYRKRGIQ